MSQVNRYQRKVRDDYPETRKLVEVTLPFQSKAPEADRLRFKAKALSWDDSIEYEREFSRVMDLPLSEQFDPLVALVKRIAVDWSGAVDGDGNPLPFDDASLRLMTPVMLKTIAAQLPDSAGWGDQKKSD